MKFYGRDNERKRLRRFFTGESQMAALIYGRRTFSR